MLRTRPSESIHYPPELELKVEASADVVIRQWEGGADSYWIATTIFGSRKAEPFVYRVIVRHQEKKANNNEWNRSAPVPLHGERAGRDQPE